MHKNTILYELQCHIFIKIHQVLDLASTTLEGSCSQLRALSLQILLSYQMLQPNTFMNIITVVYIFTYQRM